ncbi:MAG: tetratricopeptide repeat protein [Candidatus Aminicenantes bacterium]|nr:tetratricopeptide repeat protein [Candidatus Aminicenantes bacterium]
MKKKIKKKLKEDEFVSTMTKIYLYIKEQTKYIVVGVVVLIVVAGVILGLKAIKNQNLKQESEKLGQIIQLSSELMQNPEKLDELEALAGKGRFSRVAYLELASYWFYKEDFDKVLDYLGKIPEGNKDIFYYQAKNLLAETYLQKREYDKALSVYEQIEQENPKDYALDLVLFKQAEILEKQGDIDKALEIYRKLQEDYAQTFYGYEAQEKVKELEDKS